MVTDKVPGGSLIAAVLDRQLMAWSDRGGASRYLGDRWSQQCALALDAGIDREHPVPGGAPFILHAVVRLDDNPQIAIQAGRHKLVNPDFILYGSRPGGQRVLQAADAKFAVDTIRSAQVSADALRALLDVEHGLVGQALTRALGGPVVEEGLVLERGVFLSPVSPLTDFFLPRVTFGTHPRVDPREVVLLPVDARAMFADLPMSGLIPMFAAKDRLPGDPERDILLAVYYLRLACACTWMWVEDHTPLLGLEPPPQPDPGPLVSEVKRRLTSAPNSFRVLVEWSHQLEELGRARQAMKDVAPLPVRMRDLRQMMEAVGLGEARGTLRRVRGMLEKQYRVRLVEEVGEIPAHPSVPLGEVLAQVASASRRLAPEMRSLATELVEAARAEQIEPDEPVVSH